ncbi:hypothetical protein SAMN05216358_0125 [Rhizobium sp. AN5]|uniref:hypothetical protein n=1 Tax=Rhizobium sp. AN5 TaxID=1855304 RepID=UPI000BD18017|nr:hypothetical protein [Rhizobium sp. AN5]SOC90101.1 hypothetical protein SAMN05216358_0125 [Rhizobium sp. AN5]
MPKVKADQHPETKKILEQVGNEIVAALKGEFFEVDGTPMATVKYAAGNFKKKTLMAGWLFAVEYAYVGTQGKLILGMTPEDAQEYKWAELNPKEVDFTFPLIGAAVAKHFGVEGENFNTIVNSVVAERLNAKANEAELEKKQTEMALQNNELFGAF